MGYSDRFFTYDVTTTTAGTYRMYLSYISGSTRRLTVTVNGINDYPNSFNSVDWNVVYVKEIDIVLTAGLNTLKFHNPENNQPFGGGNDQWAPNVDKFRLELMVNWDGSESTDWATAGNWDTNFVPTAGDNVVIPSVSNLPIISGVTNAATRDLNVNSSLTINSGGSLIVMVLQQET
ncbi:MAG: hypothetical protein HC798_03785 [Polaribacter sp.]|nr:hypothetical protein [Polaribacter sp.]